MLTLGNSVPTSQWNDNLIRHARGGSHIRVIQTKLHTAHDISKRKYQ